MLSIPYTSRDFVTIFNDIKNIIQTIEPKADVSIDNANVESIITKIISGCVDTLSYNQDANILEAFPSTAKDARSIFDLLSIVGYTPKTARCCLVSMTLWNPSFVGEHKYEPFNYIMIDGKTFYNPDEFTITQGVVTNTNWYQGTLKSPDRKNKLPDKINNYIDYFYPNLSVNVIQNNQYKLSEDSLNIDSRTIRIYTEDGKQLKYVENPYMTNVTKASFSVLPSVNSNGYSLIFSKDISTGNLGDNFFYFYLISDGYNISPNLIPDFSGLSIDNLIPSFSYNYSVELSHPIETADEARNNITYEFGWRDTPKAIITKYDAERAVLQNFDIISAVTVRDGNDYSYCDPSLLDVQIFCKVNEETELKLNTAVADSIKNRLQTYFNNYKTLPLQFTFHIDNIETTDFENVTQLYYWYPNITIYLKEQVDSNEAAAVLNAVDEALFNRFSTTNTDFNSVPRIVDIIETVQNASDIILYLDIDGVSYISNENFKVTKEDIVCSFTQKIPQQTNLNYNIILNTNNGERYIQYNTVKIVNSYNTIIAYDNGEGTLLPYSTYLDGYGSIDYKTGELQFILSKQLEDSDNLQVLYKQETPTFCEYISRLNTEDGIKIALESLRG